MQESIDGRETVSTLFGIERIRAPIELQCAIHVVLRLEQLPGTLGQARRGWLVGHDLFELVSVYLGQPDLGIGNPR